MPRISYFRGIVILMFSYEGRHAIERFHAEYAEYRASIGFDGTVLAGGLPRAQLRLVGQWASLRQADLVANWERVLRGDCVESDHKLRSLFEDGTVGDVSFEDHEWKGIFDPLRDPTRVRQSHD
jgi:hypothetical protein